MSPVHVREKPPLRHMIDVRAPADRHYRLGEDEPDPANVPSGLRYSDTMPGGFETADCTLPRKPGVEYPDLERLSDWRVLGVGGEPYWGGRLERAPRTSGGEVSVSPQAAGWQACLDDDKSAQPGPYVDKDMSRWEQMSAQRRLNAAVAAINVFDSTVAPDSQSGEPAIVTHWQEALSKAVSEAWYDAGARSEVDSIYYEFEGNANMSPGATQRYWLAVAADDAGVTTEFSASVAAGSGSGTFSPTTPMRYGLIQTDSTTALSAQDYEVHWRKVAVFGNHGLTKRGTAPDEGFYGSDVVVHAVRMFAPQLTLKPDSVQQSSFVIPHLSFLEPTTCSEIVRQASRFDLPDWAVWDEKEFVWHQPGARGRTWRLRIGPSQLEETGPQADRVWESVIVSYQDVDGDARTVGPPASGADTESSDLKDWDPDNPANKAGITRRDILTMGVSTAAGATKVGRRFLEQAKLLDRSGKARVVGWAEDDRGVLHPFAAIRSGDYAVFVDAADTSARKIVRTDKDYDTRTCTLDLDAPPEGLQQLLERLGVVLVPLGL